MKHVRSGGNDPLESTQRSPAVGHGVDGLETGGTTRETSQRGRLAVGTL
ncbi:hypothetical protein [Natrinema sp. DC36]|nr:hypothetical protein [Natrinema sp. DC36]